MVSDPLPVIDLGCDEYKTVLFFLFVPKCFEKYWLAKEYVLQMDVLPIILMDYSAPQNH